MKTKFFVVAISIMAITATIASPVTENLPDKNNSAKIRQAPPPAFNFFRTHRQGRGVTATWGLTSEQGITGYLLQRTYEDPNDLNADWDDISIISCNANRSYKRTDENVSPGFITYRVIAFLQSGGSMMSENSTVHIVSH